MDQSQNNKINNSDQSKIDQESFYPIDQEDGFFQNNQIQPQKQNMQTFKEITWDQNKSKMQQVQQSPQQQTKPAQKMKKNKMKIILSLTLAFLSLLSVQIQMQHYGPFVRTVQCFFNYHILEHDSQDIYEAPDVIYYRTAEYYLKNEIIGFFRNYQNSIEVFFEDSFFTTRIKRQQGIQIQKGYSLDISDLQMIIIYDNSLSPQIQNKNIRISRKNILFKDWCTLDLKNNNSQTKFDNIQDQETYFCRCSINEIQAMFNDTVFIQDFFQYLYYVQMTIYLPIKYRGNPSYIKLKAIGELDSGLLMSVKIQTDLVDQNQQILSNRKLKKQKEFEQSQPDNLQIRKLPNMHDMGLQMVYLKWIIFVINFILFFIELRQIAKKNRQIDNELIEQRKQSYVMIQQIGEELQRQIQKQTDKQKPEYLQSVQKCIQNRIEKEALLEELSEPIKMPIKERLQKIGKYKVVQIVISLLILASTTNQGLVSLFCWTKLAIYLSSTGNNLMLGFLFKKTLPLFLKLIVSILILLSAFVFFSMIVYQTTKKFQSVQLAFYEYLFNYFQYGIYQNFMPIRKYGSSFTLLYFVHLVILVSIGNQILQSLMAQQILKNSNMKSLLKIIENIQVQCPICGCPPEIKKKLKVNIKKQNKRQKQFISKYFEDREKQDDDYEIQIISPKLSPLFHKQKLKPKQKKLRKFSKEDIQNRLSPRLQPLSPKQVSHSPSPGKLSPQNKKKVKIQIGQTLKQVERTVLQQFQRKIKMKRNLIDDLIHQFETLDAKKKIKFKQTYIGFFKEKLSKTGKLLKKIQQQKF